MCNNQPSAARICIVLKRARSSSVIRLAGRLLFVVAEDEMMGEPVEEERSRVISTKVWSNFWRRSGIAIREMVLWDERLLSPVRELESVD